MTKGRGLKVKFWGVRGSFPCPHESHLRYGGNTSCISIQAKDQLIVLDAGTGLRPLGQWLVSQPIKKLTLLLSHVHWDHISGFPFFDPAYHLGYHIDIYAGNLKPQKQSIAEIMRQQMQAPTFPIEMKSLEASINFHDFSAGEQFNLGSDITVRTAPLSHPNEATGYRIECQGKSICYVTDTEHAEGVLDPTILALIDSADLVIYDSTYTDEEFKNRVGWGHSTWQQGVRLAQSAGAKQLAIFHHDPDHDDNFMDRVASEASTLWGGAFVAKEGQSITLAD